MWRPEYHRDLALLIWARNHLATGISRYIEYLAYVFYVLFLCFFCIKSSSENKRCTLEKNLWIFIRLLKISVEKSKNVLVVNMQGCPQNARTCCN